MAGARGTHRTFFTDSKVLVRFLTDDPPIQARAVERVLDGAREGRVTLIVPDLVVAELAYVLTSVYRLSNDDAGERITELLSLPGVEVADSDLLRDVVSIWRLGHLDFTDAYLAGLARATKDIGLLSFDKDFDTITGAQRTDPRALTRGH